MTDSSLVSYVRGVDLDSPQRLQAIRGRLLSTARDELLQSAVEESARLSGCPIALVTLLMGSVQLFRAAVGLPPELETSRATSRCDSFCQFVVRDEAPFVIEHASADASLPQRLVGAFSIESYAGVPLRVHGQVLGALCVIDQVPRRFQPQILRQLDAIAQRVCKRLEALSIEEETSFGSSAEGLARSVAFQAELLQRAFTEVGPVLRLAGALNEGTLTLEEVGRAMSVLTDVIPVFEAFDTETKRLGLMARALQRKLQ